MGIQINGNNDIISALDGSWTAEGASINTSGILTATTFKGNIVGTAATFTGPVTIGGTLTYEDVTNIDSVGLITARDGLKVIAGGIKVLGGVSNFNNNIVATATTALSVTAADESSDTSCNVLFSTAATGNVAPKTGTNLTFNSSSGALTATSFVGALPISNDTNNRVLTGTGSGGINGESNLTFDHNQLFINCGNYSYPIVINSTQSSVRAVIRQTNDANANSGLAIQKKHSTLHPANHWYGDISFEGWDGSGYHKGGLIECVASGTPANDNMPGELRFSTNSGGTGTTKILTITKDGHLYHTGGGNGRRYSFASDGSSHYMKHDTTLNGIILNGYGGITFETNGTNERLRIASNGKVGINIAGSDNTSPVRNLDIADSSGAILRLISTDDSLGANERLGEIEFYTDDDDGGHIGAFVKAIADPSDSFGRRTALTFGTQATESANAVERVRINAQGNVGINEVSPDTKLHITGGSNESITLKLEPGGTAGNYSEIVLGRTSSAPAAQTTPVVKGGIPISGVPGILFGSENTNLPAIGFQTPNSSNGHIVFSPKGSERVRIDALGRLLVNVTSQSISSNERFEVSGMSYFSNDSTSTGTIYVRNQQDNTANVNSGAGAPFIVYTDGGGNRGGFFMNDSEQMGISSHGSLMFYQGNTAPANPTKPRGKLDTDGMCHTGFRTVWRRNHSISTSSATYTWDDVFHEVNQAESSFMSQGGVWDLVITSDNYRHMALITASVIIGDIDTYGSSTNSWDWLTSPTTSGVWTAGCAGSPFSSVSSTSFNYTRGACNQSISMTMMKRTFRYDRGLLGTAYHQDT